MTQHCHETVKKALIWATEAWPWGGRFRNCSPRQEPPTALKPHCSSPIHITPCPTATLCSHLLLTPPSRQPQPTAAGGGDASCLLVGVQSLLLSQPWLFLHDPNRNYSYGPASHLPLPSCCTVTESPGRSELQRLPCCKGSWKYRERTLILWLWSAPILADGVPSRSPLCCSLGTVLEADMVTLISVWAKQFANQLHCHSTIHN